MGTPKSKTYYKIKRATANKCELKSRIVVKLILTQFPWRDSTLQSYVSIMRNIIYDSEMSHITNHLHNE